ncbi:MULTISPECIES: 50S ribosomal protein L33 [Solobacterium]|jgi:ribosomal protein L33|nr:MULTISPECIES: 50S ribosomal protein L33 [Solobacterium]MBF1072075.1 50S ribosomal protein L33 [Solobacterium sp.]MBF1077429.1 50S ribosomal protein L33 [Solobacterium sp.]MBF1085961.1 50S ribosomal protein L33 [Solobacterium sp.]MBF1088713.1 50S ribosomal protein L33 [Solobacterium sp.]MBF1090905.1 50S ribosomal protein L33 [Solobacterium sp.]
MAKEARKIILACEECLARNYTTNGSKNSTKRLELKKFCPKCGKMTLHKETK